MGVGLWRKLDVEAILHGRGVHHAVTELYSPPIIVDMAHAMGFKGGYSLDLTNPSPDGRAWDFSKASDRMRCWRLVKRDRPYLIIGSPPCTLFSALQNLSRGKPGYEAKYQLELSRALVHLEFCAQICKMGTAIYPHR